MKKKQNNKFSFNSSLIKKAQQNAMFKEECPLVILVVFFIIFILLVYSLPDNLLTDHPMLRQYVDFMAAIFPSVNGYMKYSTFPQIAAFTFAAGIILCVPATIYIGFCLFINTPFKSVLHEVKAIFVGLILGAFFIYIFFYFFPDGLGSAMTRRGRMLEHVLNSRIVFSIINAAILWLISSIFAALYQRARRILNYLCQPIMK